MLNPPRLGCSRERGVSLIEVLVTLMVLAFGLLGVAGLQAKMSLAEMEAYQRSQAVQALTEMTERMSANGAQATSYLNQGTIGGTGPVSNCTTIAPGPTRDLCEWSNSLKGASEQAPANSGGKGLGAVGCITQLKAYNPALGVCSAGVYQVSVAWWGMSPTKTPALTCGQGSYGADAYRRVIAATVTVGTTSCF